MHIYRECCRCSSLGNALQSFFAYKRKAEDVEPIINSDVAEGESGVDAFQHRCVSKAPVAAFTISSFVSSSYKRKTDDVEQLTISSDEDSDNEINVVLLRCPRPTSQRPLKRQRVGEVNHYLFSSNLTPCDELRFMAHDLRRGWITSKQAYLIARYITKQAKRTQQGWRRRGVDCSPGRLVTTCREEAGLEWMFEIELNVSDDKENQSP